MLQEALFFCSFRVLTKALFILLIQVVLAQLQLVSFFFFLRGRPTHTHTKGPVHIKCHRVSLYIGLSYG